MTSAEFWRRADRLQKTRWFQITVSAVVAVLAITGYIVANAVLSTDAAVDQIVPTDADSAAANLVRSVLENQTDAGGVGIGLLIGAGVLLVITWLGLSLTYLGIMLAAGGVAAGLHALGQPFWAQLVLGLGGLTMTFSALLRGARVLLSGPNAIVAIAGNVLAEAVRLKLSMVFIIMLVFGLSALPWVLDDNQDLRYRVQSFLQYAAGGSFWIIALLTLTFGAATVAFEQRDKVIWQTITKPVATWEYVLGKWLGVSTLAAVLLAVSSAGTFLFVEYLRDQPATGEIEAFVAAEGAISADRLVLETQVLAARQTIPPTLPFGPRDEEFLAAVETFIQNERIADEEFARGDAARQRVMEDLYKSRLDTYFSVPIGGITDYRFTGLQSLRSLEDPITLRYRIDAQGNRPDTTYTLTFAFEDGGQVVQRVGLGISHTLTIPPESINESGELNFNLVNGLVGFIDGRLAVQANETSISIPRETFHLSYSAGSYHQNYFRIAAVLWLKLAFLAAVAIWAATFLSFPVACLISIAIFLMAESTSFLADAIDMYGTENSDREVVWYKFLAYWISFGIDRVFSVYNELRPTGRLVEGRLMSLGDLVRAVGVLGTLSAVFAALASVALKRRELAIYSGR